MVQVNAGSVTHLPSLRFLPQFGTQPASFTVTAIPVQPPKSPVHGSDSLPSAAF